MPAAAELVAAEHDSRTHVVRERRADYPGRACGDNWPWASSNRARGLGWRATAADAGSSLRTNPLRAEFVLTGVTLIACVAWLMAAISRPFTGIEVFEGAWLDLSAGSAILILAALIAVGYIVGAAVTQLMFNAFVSTLRKGIRERHTRALDQLVEALELNADIRLMHHGAITELAASSSSATDGGRLGRAWRMYWGSSDPNDDADITTHQIARDLVSHLGRRLANDEMMRELEYRRSNRQVFLGAIPAVLIGSAAACVTFLGAGFQATAATIVLVPAIGIGGTRHLIAAAGFQERHIVMLDQNTLFIHAAALYPPAAVDE